MIWHIFFQPFIEYGFMRRALVVCLALSVSTTALGVFLQLRRMSLMGDALSHAILPGVAVGYLLSGMSLLAMSVGGFIAGITVALVAGLVSRRTPLKEDASFAGFYLGSLALGVTLVSLRGSSVDLLHLLFGSILAVDNDAALFVAGVCMFTLITLAIFYRGLVTEAFDTAWLQVNARHVPGLLHGLFLALLVLNLVAGFQVLGTLMAVGLCGSGTLLGTHLTRTAIDGGYQRYFLRVARTQSLLGRQPARGAVHRAYRQRAVLYFHFIWHAQQAGWQPACAFLTQGETMKRTGLVVALALGMMSQTVMAKTLNVVTSFSILGDMTREVGGDHVNVTTLVGPDGDPHTFEPSPKDSAALSKADVVVVNGLGLEGWLDRLVKASGFKGQLVVASRGVQTHTLEEEGKTVTDPHAWNSAANGALYAQNILNGLVKADPEDKTALEATGKPYIEQLKQLDSWAKTRFSQIPLVKRKVLTSHDAFGYFSRAYGVAFMAPQGLSSESEASAAQVAEIINQIKADGVKTWFMENQLDPRLVKQIATATGAQPGGELYPEALSAKGGVAETYVKAFRHNVDTLADSMK